MQVQRIGKKTISQGVKTVLCILIWARSTLCICHSQSCRNPSIFLNLWIKHKVLQFLLKFVWTIPLKILHNTPNWIFIQLWVNCQKFPLYAQQYAQLSLYSAWLILCWNRGGWDVNFLLSISSSCVNIRLHTQNPISKKPRSALKVCVVGGGG